MRSALVPSRDVAADPYWRRFLEDLQRELWGDDRSDGLKVAAPKSREDRP
jgi:hypothetical protein